MSVHPASRPTGGARGRRIVVLLSGAGSNLAALLRRDDLGGRVVLVLADRHDAGGLEIAASAGIPAASEALSEHADRVSWEAALADRVAGAAPDLVVLAGFMKILSADFVHRWPVLNVHPSLLPAFPGAHAVADALDYGVKLTGCTVHFVDEQVDHGPIVAQAAVEIAADDDVDRLHGRIKQVEYRLLADAVGSFCRGELKVTGRRVERVGSPG